MKLKNFLIRHATVILALASIAIVVIGSCAGTVIQIEGMGDS